MAFPGRGYDRGWDGQTGPDSGLGPGLVGAERSSGERLPPEGGRTREASVLELRAVTGGERAPPWEPGDLGAQLTLPSSCDPGVPTSLPGTGLSPLQRKRRVQ